MDKSPIENNVTAAQAAKIAGCSVRNICWACRIGSIKLAQKFGRQWSIHVDALDEWIADEAAHRTGPKVKVRKDNQEG